jgi:hypothetical protein
MIYLYRENYIIGISNEILEYIGVKKEKILDVIHKNEKNIVYLNDFSLNYKMKTLINNKKYITPYFLSLKISK